MNLKGNLRKFNKHKKVGGLFYALYRGLRYCIYMVGIKKSRRPFLCMLRKDAMRVVCDGEGINLFYNNNRITQGVGLLVAIGCRGLWTDSTKARWKITERGEDFIKTEIALRKIPVVLVWLVRVKNNIKIEWEVDIKLKKAVAIDEVRFLCLTEANYKTWVSDFHYADFPRFDNHWHDIYKEDFPSSLVGVRFPLGDDPKPSFTIEAQGKNLLALVQNPPLAFNARLIGFRLRELKDKLNHDFIQHHLFAGTINILEDDKLLDDRIENIRQYFLTSAINKEVEKKKHRSLKVLLVNLPWQRDGRWGVRAGSRWPHIKDKYEDSYLPFPFFLAYAASLLQINDIDVSIIDAVAERISEDVFLEMISSMDIDYLFAETSIPSFYYDLGILKRLSLEGIQVILGGPNYEIYNTRFLENHPFINFVLYGEYEYSLLELIKTLESGRDLSNVKGLIYKENGLIFKAPPREPVDINTLPWPHRDTLPMNSYLDAPGGMLTPSVQMQASRGCPFSCQFCLWPQVFYRGNHYRPREIKDVVDEMEFLVKEKKFKSVYFDDDTFNIGRERMLSFCSQLRQRGLQNIQWSIMARPDLMDEELLESMKKAGLWAVKYGVESANQTLLNKIGKNMDLQRTERMIKLTKKLGIQVHLTFTFGLPGETSQTIDETIRYVQQLDPFSAQFSIMTPFPGTKFYEVLEERGCIVSKDYSCYDGQSRSVIAVEGLTSHDLEEAKERACRVWEYHLKKRHRFLDNVRKFYHCTRHAGLRHAVCKSISYFK